MNNQELIKLRNEIMECFTCDEEIMDGGDSVIESRIDEVLNSRFTISNQLGNDYIMLNTSVLPKTKMVFDLHGILIADLFGKHPEISDSDIKLHYKSIIDAELSKFKVKTLPASDIFWDDLGIRTPKGEISIHLRKEHDGHRHIMVRVDVISNRGSLEYKDDFDCNNSTEFNFIIKLYLDLII
jgi:hypothetical protein